MILELGNPVSSVSRGDREVFYYPKDRKVELTLGRVTHASASLLTVEPSPAPADSMPPVAPSHMEDIAPSSPEPAPRDAPVDINASSTDYEDYEEDSPPSLLQATGIILLTLSIQFGLTIAALKIAFHYQQMDALWPGLLSIAAIDIVLQSAFAFALFYKTGEIRLGIAGAGLPGLAMILSIRKFCFDQRWSRATATTGAVKMASIVLNLSATWVIAMALD